MSDYSLNLVSKAVSLVSGFAVSIIVARYLGVVLRGDYAYVTQVAGLVAIFLGFGLNYGFPYFFKHRLGKSTFEVFMRIFLIQFAAYVVLSFGVFALVNSELVRATVVLVAPAVLYQQLEGSMAVYNIRLKIWANIGMSIFRVVAFVGALSLFPRGLIWPVVLTALAWLVPFFVYLVAARRMVFIPVNLVHAPAIFRYSWLPMLSALLVVLNYNVDTVLLKWLGTPDDLGHYAVAAGLIVYLWVIADAIKEVLVSRVARSSDPRLVVGPLKIAVAATLVCALFLAAVGRPLISLAFGPAYSPSYPLLLILSLGAIGMIYFKILGVVMLADGRSRLYFVSLAAAVMINVVVNLFAIPRFGAAGAAWTTVLSYSVTAVVFSVHFCRISGVRARNLFVVRRADLAQFRSRIGR
ncbi:O-antigen/teichoic acid export membrane protein [Antricoccus suffuscus]|uniref:O-antigen/teichoic acid export membrane protein n=1 Tax=Antricoccus suffuscus TaxID=1629062 RepID=A0A2T1A5X9_9ACTN|nr:polysaccharide biosynthesis C-terminal domain-containing protein [Antricoccus suffuscus]PRZ44015.1 O-antigen/teichoic acid export membrane protein [Antricoccus suffuscus]